MHQCNGKRGAQLSANQLCGKFCLYCGYYHFTGRRIHRQQQSFFCIKVDERRGFFIISVEAVIDGFLGFVFALHHGAAALVADAAFLGRHAFDVVDRLALRVGAGTAGG